MSITDPDWDTKVALSYQRDEDLPRLANTPGDQARDELLAMLDDVDLGVIKRASIILAKRDTESLDRLMEIWHQEETLQEGAQIYGIIQLEFDGHDLEEILLDRREHGRPTVQAAAQDILELYFNYEPQPRTPNPTPEHP